MATPQIPPRPSRSQNLEPTNTGAMNIPTIPPRPKGKRDTSESPNRTAFARSPLNDPSFVHNAGAKAKSLAPKEMPTLAKRPSVHRLPSVGQEGDEYSAVDEPGVEDASPPKKTKAVAKDLPLHAPTASVPAATAKQRIVGVTRTDSEKVAIAGIGKLVAEKSGSQGAQRAASSNGSTRPPSIHAKDDEKHGIPNIGVQVPMYPNAGDVQAPTPSPVPPQGSTGIGFFNNGGHVETKRHSRTPSGRQVFKGPPGSYGLHGHGVKPQDPLERDWYEKHPNERAQEAKGEYGPKIQDNRKDYHLSTEDLNKLVHHRIVPSRENAGTPAEEVGYQVSEEYNSRISSVKPPSPEVDKKRRSSSLAHAESPLRQAFVPDDTMDVQPLKGGLAGATESRESLALERTKTEEDRWAQEHGYDVPILASDEVAKHDFVEHLQPAVSPEFDRERRRSAEYTQGDSGLRKVSSRPTSGLYNLSRNSTREELEGIHTSLDKVQEYEPLFPEDDDPKLQTKKPTAVEKLKRPGLGRYHFPSQDVWEDAPEHVHLSATVETPEPDDDAEEAEIDNNEPNPSTTFEKPEAEAARKETITKEDQQSFLSDHTKKLAKTHLTGAQLADMPTRPGSKGLQRFPSRDIWEDAPDDVHQFASVDTPEDELDRQALLSPEEEKPEIPARPIRAKATEPVALEKAFPIIPERPKPQIPARPAKSLHRGSNETSPLEKTTSAGSDEGAPAVKPKPMVPARPGGNKLAALKAGFMSDLNSRLQLGPSAPKPKEPEKEEPKEQAPLADARKGRAKGPQRRRPAASPSGTAGASEPAKQASSLKISVARDIWSISDDGDLNLGATDNATSTVSPVTTLPTKPVPTSKLAFEVPQEDANESRAAGSKTLDETIPEPLAKQQSNTSETATQTGEMNISVSSPTGEKEHFIVYKGGNAHNGDVIIDNNGVEHVDKKLDSPEALSATMPASVASQSTVAPHDKAVSTEESESAKA